MLRTVLALFFITASAGLTAQPAKEAAADVNGKVAKINSYQATIKTTDSSAEGGANATSATLLVSKQHGWKLDSTGPEGPSLFISDFKTFYQYFPKENQASKTVADRPEAEALFRKPVTDLNPLELLDQNSLSLVAEEQLNGETVYHFKGTTSTQFVPQGAPVVRSMDAWISKEDGLPRKTIETIEGSTGTTEYSNVKVNIPVTADQFKFVPPPGTQIVDMNAEIRRMEESMKADREGSGTAQAAPEAPRQP